MGRHCRENGVGKVIVERFSAAPLLFRDAGARSGVVQRPSEYPLLEEVIEQVLKPSGQIVPPVSCVETADAVEDFPNGDGCKTDPLAGDRVQKCSDARLRVWAHHLRDDVRIEEPSHRSGHVSLSPANSTGRYV